MLPCDAPCIQPTFSEESGRCSLMKIYLLADQDLIAMYLTIRYFISQSAGDGEVMNSCSFALFVDC